MFFMSFRPIGVPSADQRPRQTRARIKCCQSRPHRLAKGANPLTKLTLVGWRLTSVTSHLFGNRVLVLPSDFAVTNGLMTDGRLRYADVPTSVECGTCSRYKATNNERPHLLVFHFLHRGDTFIKVNVRLGVCPRFSLLWLSPF